MKWLFNKIPAPWNYVSIAAAVVLIIFVIWILTKICRRIFAKMQKSRNGLHLVFFEKMAVAAIVIVGVILTLSSINGFDSVWSTFLGGTAIVSAVLAFAAQDVIKDILAGLMISLHKPFEIGDRIALEDGTTGIVSDITMRHIVLQGIDTLKIVIPNSKLNAMQLINFSSGDFDRSIHFNFSVGYDSDIELVKRVIYDAVKESEYTIPVSKKKGAVPAYPPVYFLKFADSALIMAVTVYYEKCFTSETLINDINTRVREALIANGIEIPYNYVTVVEKDKPAGNE